MSFSHEAGSLAGHQKRSDEVGFNYFSRGLNRAEQQVVHRSDAGIIDQDIEASVGIRNFREHLFDCVFIRHIETEVTVIRRLVFGFFPAAADDLMALRKIMVDEISADALTTTSYQEHSRIRRGLLHFHLTVRRHMWLAYPELRKGCFPGTWLCRQQS